MGVRVGETRCKTSLSSHDRLAEIYGGQTTIHSGPERDNYLLLPIVP
jgi:hypothetical protein